MLSMAACALYQTGRQHTRVLERAGLRESKREREDVCVCVCMGVCVVKIRTKDAAGPVAMTTMMLWAQEQTHLTSIDTQA